MTSFLDLPCSLTAIIVSQYLKSISGLDRACCNHNLRTQVRNTYRAYECFIKCTMLPVLDQPSMFSWLMRREIRAEALQVSLDCSDAVVTEYLERFGQHVLAIESSPSTYKIFITDVCRTCSNLKCLSTCQFSNDFPLFFPILETLHLSAVIFDETNIAEPLLRQLSLENLCLLATEPAVTSLISEKLLQRSVTFLSMFTHENWVAICRRCPLLRSLQCFVFDDTLIEMVKLCPHIVHLCLDAASNYEENENFSLTDVGLSYAAKHLQLRSLCVLQYGAWSTLHAALFGAHMRGLRGHAGSAALRCLLCV